jgi:tape measure domain-containing protein
VPDAKITLTTEAKSDELQKLNKALADGQQSVAEMTKELNDMRKATKEGTQATKEQRDAMVELRKSINEQKAANKSYATDIGKTTAEIKKSVKAMADGDKGARGLASAFKLTEGFTTAFSVALGGLAASITAGVVSALGDMANQVISLGAQMQQSVAHLAAMTGGADTAAEAYRALNDVYRNTNFDEQAVFNMGEQLMRMGYSAQNAAGLIQLCADAAAGLGTGQQGAQQLVDAISRMQAVGELTSKQLVGLKMAGVDMDAAFKSLGMNGEEAMKAVENGTLDTQQAIGALTEYLHQYDGKMTESKNNTIDAWGDVTGNLSTMCAEIGNSIFDAFNQSEIIQTLIDFTQSLVDMVRGDGCGAFSDLRAVADEVLNFIAGLLQFVFDTIKLVIIIINDAYIAFKNFGAQVVDAIRPAVDAVMALYNAVKAVMSSVGAGFHSEVAKSWGITFSGGSKGVAAPNHFKVRSSGGGGGSRSGGGGGGGSAAKALSEEEKAVEALIKKYADASKQKWNLAKSAIELARTNLAALSQENRITEERQIKLQALQDAHDQMMEGYQKELDLAGKIQDATIRENTVKSINDQVDAENKLFEAKKRRIDLESDRAARDYQATAFANEMAHIQNLFTMQQVNANQRMELENQVLEARKTQLQEMSADASLYAEDRIKIEKQLADTISQINANAVYDMKTGWQQALVELANQQVNFKDAFTGAFESIEGSLVSLVSSTGSAKDKFKQFCQDVTNTILKSMAQIIIKGLITKAIMGAIGLGGGNTNASDWAFTSLPGGIGVHAATGGYISGPGTGTSDSIPAMLSNGEYVIRSSAVDRIGVAALNRLNKMGHFANGGVVGSAGGGFGPNVVVNIENQTGMPVTAEQTESTWDGESWVIGIVMNGIVTNKNGMRTVLKGAMA